MFAKVQTIMKIIESLAPKKYALEMDNIGLQVGNPNNEINKILVALNVSNEVVEEAIAKGCGMIVSHHPLIFNKISSVRNDLYIGEVLYKLIKNDINVYCAHTNLDIAPGGVNDVLAKELNLELVRPLQITNYDSYKKIVVFVPNQYVNNVISALAKAGAGWIGNYSHCTFRAEGKGTFMPLEGTNPFIGETDKIEEVKEVRIETIVVESKLKNAVRAMLDVHPYEEVAYDIYNLEIEGKPFGLGRIGTLSHSVSLKELAHTVKAIMEVSSVRVAGNLNRSVKRVAVCGGSGASEIHQATFKGADVLITGDVKYHQAQEAINIGLSILDIGHWESEKLILPVLVDAIEKGLDGITSMTKVIKSEVNDSIFEFI